MSAGSFRGGVALQHLFNQVNSPTGAVQLIAQQLVGGAGGGAETAVHAAAQYFIGLLALAGV